MRLVTVVTVAAALAGASAARAQAPYLVKDINPVGGSDPFQLTVAGDRLFFEATQPGGEGRDLWVTEGTAATTLPTPVHPGPANSGIYRPLGLGRDLLFTNFGLPLTGLWRAGGSPASTTFIKPILVGPSTTIGSVALLVANNGLWRSDGTPAGTSQLVPLDTSNTNFPTAFVGALGDTRFLTASGFPPELWRSDGTPAGSVRVATLGAEAGAALGDKLILVAAGGLWKADRTTLGVQQIPATGPLFPEFPVAANGRVFFAAHTDATGLELWTTDGTASGTTLVKDILPGPQGGLADMQPMAFSPFVVLGSSVYFVANDGVHGRELWRSNGTEKGTVLVGETIPGPQSGIESGTTHVPDSMVAAGGLLFFASRTVAEGLELWQSDGLTAPVLRADVAPGPSSSTPANFRTDGRRLYFTADDGAAGSELWALDLLPSLAVDDVSVTEGDTAPGTARFTVRLAPPAAVAAVVAYATADLSATADADYSPRSGTVTFAPGETTATIDVPILPDLAEEGDEAFVLRLSAPQVASITDGEATALLRDDDAPRVAVAGVSVIEGDGGTTPATFDVTFVTKDGGAAVLAHTVTYSAGSGTAILGVDFAATAGALSFQPGTPSGAHVTVNVPVIGDTLDEPYERFTLRLTPASEIVTPAAPAYGTILDDDGAAATWPVELSHGTTVRADLAPPAGPGPDRDYYMLQQQPEASFELVVDEASGDAAPLTVQRVAADGTTVLQSASPVGTGTGLSLRWLNTTFDTISDEHVRVESASCGTICGTDDTYRVRFYETTLRGARVNNTNGQTTVLLLQNLTDAPVLGFIHFRTEDGVSGGGQGYAIPARGTLVHDMSQNLFEPGSLWVTHDAPYGGVAGKVVGLEPATGFSFDTPLTSKPR